MTYVICRGTKHDCISSDSSLSCQSAWALFRFVSSLIEKCWVVCQLYEISLIRDIRPDSATRNPCVTARVCFEEQEQLISMKNNSGLPLLPDMFGLL